MTALQRIQKIEQEVAKRLEIPRERVRAIFYLNEDLQPIVIVEVFCENGYAAEAKITADEDEQVISTIIRKLRSDYAEAISALQKVTTS
ncbi:MAG: hypothetical protein QXT58_05435 [Archaeoglobaceae archaeon]